MPLRLWATLDQFFVVLLCKIPAMCGEITHPGRKSLRLPQIDYSLPNAYFVTIVTHQRLQHFGRIIDGNMQLNDAGRMIDFKWTEIAQRFSQIELDRYVVMPNHFHGIIRIMQYSRVDADQGVGANPVFAPAAGLEGSHSVEIAPGLHGTDAGTLGRIIQDFKTGTTNRYIEGVREKGWRKFPGKLWQKNYYESIVRDEKMLNEFREYIVTNPLRWELDKENPVRKT